MTQSIHFTMRRRAPRWAVSSIAVIMLTALSASPVHSQAKTASDSVAATQQQSNRDAAATKAAAADTVVQLYAVPDIPAIAFLNGNTASISRPITVKDLAASLANGVDERGHAKQGFALEVSPFLIPGFASALADGSNPLATLASRALGSLATVQSAGDSSSTDVAWGLRLVLFDGGDPMRDTSFRGALSAMITPCANKYQGVPPTNLKPGQTQIDSALAKELADRRDSVLACMHKAKTDSLVKDYAKTHWNATRLLVAYGGGLRLPQSTFSKREQIGHRVWATGSYGIGTTTQLIGYLDWQRHDALDTVPGFDAVDYGGRINFGSNKANAFYELLGESRSNAAASVPKTATKWSLGLEFLATQGVWISTGIGKRATDLLKPDKVVVIANIRWGISSKPWLSP